MATNVLILQFVFEELGLNRLYTDYLEDHEISANIFKKMEFTIEGTARKEVFKNGEFHNVVRVSLLKREYDELVIKNQTQVN